MSPEPQSKPEPLPTEPRLHPPAMVAEVLAYLRCPNSAEVAKAFGFTASPQLNSASTDSENIENDAAGSGTTPSITLPDDAVLIDGTLGTAGHTLAMLRAHPTCRVVAFDRDAESQALAKRRLEAANVAERVTLVQGDFRHARELLQPYFDNKKVGTDGRPIQKIDGALVDAGMSLYQVTWAERGLSFRADAPLDMRYDRTQSWSAYDLVNRLSPEELEDLIFGFTDEKWARRITAFITERRSTSPIRTTGELASLIEAAIPVGVRRQSRVHPATKTFAALRLAVNDEFWALDQGAWALSQVLAPAARLVILTYSSHEDRTVKRTFRRLAGRSLEVESPAPYRKTKSTRLSGGRDFRPMRSTLTLSDLNLALPAQTAGVPNWAETEGFETQWRMKIVTSRPIEPTEAEVERNPLSRSCKLRAIEKVALDDQNAKEYRRG